MSRETEQQVWVEAWARRIDALGLTSIVLPLVDLAHTFGFLSSQALLIAQPLASGIVNNTTIERAVTLLDSPELLGQLKTCLEEEKS